MSIQIAPEYSISQLLRRNSSSLHTRSPSRQELITISNNSYRGSPRTMPSEKPRFTLFWPCYYAPRARSNPPTTPPLHFPHTYVEYPSTGAVFSVNDQPQSATPHFSRTYPFVIPIPNPRHQIIKAARRHKSSISALPLRGQYYPMHFLHFKHKGACKNGCQENSVPPKQRAESSLAPRSMGGVRYLLVESGRNLETEFGLILSLRARLEVRLTPAILTERKCTRVGIRMGGSFDVSRMGRLDICSRLLRSSIEGKRETTSSLRI